MSKSYCNKCKEVFVDNNPDKETFLRHKCGRWFPALTEEQLKAYAEFVPKPINIPKQSTKREGVPMKNEEKKALAEKVIALLESEGVSVTDRTKVLSVAYKLASAAKPAKE